MKRWMVGVFCAVFMHMACAAGADAVRQRAEASMLVTGWIEVTPKGGVHDYGIDHADKIPPVVVSLIQKSLPTWKFTLDHAPTVTERASMSLRIIAKRIDDTHDSVAITGASFSDANSSPDDHVTYKDRQPPTYPQAAIQARVDGTVYLFLRIGKQGQVEDAAAEQVNLGVYGRDLLMQRYRDMLADAALKAAKQWTFKTPTTGKHIDDPYWYVRVPVAFNLNVAGSPRQDSYGQWQVYIPGPRQSVPWEENKPETSSTTDAIPAGSISQVSQDLHLTTPLEGS